MQFIYEAKQARTGATALENNLTRALLKHSRVLWLVCGGSSIPKIAEVMQAIPAGLSAKLHIMLTDERYGEPGHADSNYQQLLNAGFNPKQAVFIPALQDGASLNKTVETYQKSFRKESTEAGYTIATFGIGPDSHIAGILPNSPATKVNKLAAGYDAGQFKRLTLTFPAIKQIDAAYVFAYGENKAPALTKLRDTTADLTEEPCQILKAIPEVSVYNDCIP